MSIIIITGTPGTGKTSLAKALERKLNIPRLDIATLISQQGLCEYVDEAKDCQVIDADKLVDTLRPILEKAKAEKGMIIDSHLIHHLPAALVDLCIVTKCDLAVLKKRLEQRDYPQAKVRENLDVEIFDTCLTEAERQGHKVMVINTSRNPDWEDIIPTITKHLDE